MVWGWKSEGFEEGGGDEDDVIKEMVVGQILLARIVIRIKR